MSTATEIVSSSKNTFEGFITMSESSSEQSKAEKKRYFLTDYPQGNDD